MIKVRFWPSPAVRREAERVAGCRRSRRSISAFPRKHLGPAGILFRAAGRFKAVRSAAADLKLPPTQSLRSPDKAELDIKSRRKLTLSEYVRRRNGVPLGASGSLRNMLHRSFGARSFAGFWQYWNPIFGYYLGTYVFVPLKKVAPPGVALVLTFVVTGAIHDVVTMAVRQDVAFLFTPWFLFLGIGVVLSKVTKMDIGASSWWRRAAIHTTYLGVCLALTLLIFNVT